jgi:hypothetical protein
MKTKKNAMMEPCDEDVAKDHFSTNNDIAGKFEKR